MRMAPRTRKLALAAHVAASVGWLGAVAAFLALAISGLAGDDPARVRGAYAAMEVVAWQVILPLALAALLTGLVQSLGTEWGLLRHHWVVAKLLITVVSTLLLLLHLQPVSHLARLAAVGAIPGESGRLQLQMVVDSALAAVAILAALLLSVLKPRGMTRWGRRWRARQAPGPGA
jgi:hypothetical protein